MSNDVGITELAKKDVNNIFEPRVSPEGLTYKGEVVDLPSSMVVKEIIEAFFGGYLLKYLGEKYGCKAVLMGSVAKGVSVRKGMIDDIDARLVSDGGGFVTQSELAKLAMDEELYEMCLRFLDSADQEDSQLGAVLKERGITLLNKQIDFIGEMVEGKGVEGFQVAAWSYRRRFNKTWESDTTDYDDPFAKMRREILEDVQRAMGTKNN